MDVAVEMQIYIRCTCGKRLDDRSSYQDEEGLEITVSPCFTCMKVFEEMGRRKGGKSQ